jgi:hypothetical protein
MTTAKTEATAIAPVFGAGVLKESVLTRGLLPWDSDLDASRVALSRSFSAVLRHPEGHRNPEGGGYSSNA